VLANRKKLLVLLLLLALPMMLTAYSAIADEGFGQSIVALDSKPTTLSGIVNSSRAFETPMDADTKTTILIQTKTVQTKLQRSASKYRTFYYPSSASADAFISSLQTRLPSATLIHSHGNSSDGGRIYLVDDSYVNAAGVTEALTGASKIPGGLFYAAICEGAAQNTLGNAFVNAGYQAYIGYTVSVYTDRNAAFYAYFFTKATVPDVSVKDALAETVTWALAQEPPWTDVATATIIGDGTVVYLGGATQDTTFSGRESTQIENVTVPFIGWRDASDMVLNNYEMDAVQTADEVPKAQALKDKYGDNLATGVEDLATVTRVSYKNKATGLFLYGVDVDKATGQIVAQGKLD
jgi:hypothetical protein